jgi:hypothetical protein
MGWPFNARRNLAGLTLRATDTDWAVGTGPEVAGDALSLLLLLTGRTTAVMDALHGPGVTPQRLTGQLMPPPARPIPSLSVQAMPPQHEGAVT